MSHPSMDIIVDGVALAFVACSNQAGPKSFALTQDLAVTVRAPIRAVNAECGTQNAGPTKPECVFS